MISHLHARLAPEFLTSLLSELLNVLASSNPTPSAATPATDRDKEEKERVVRLRPVLRVIAELGLVGAWENARGGKANKGVISDQVGQEHVFERVKGLVSLPHSAPPFRSAHFHLAKMSGDPTYSNIPLLVTFLKSYKRAYLGDAATSDVAASNGTQQELVSPDFQSKFRQLFESYFNTASKALIKGQTVSRRMLCDRSTLIRMRYQKLLEQDKKNYEAYIKAGEIFEDRQNAYEKMTKAVEKLHAGVQR